MKKSMKKLQLNKLDVSNLQTITGGDLWVGLQSKINVCVVSTEAPGGCTVSKLKACIIQPTIVKCNVTDTCSNLHTCTGPGGLTC